MSLVIRSYPGNRNMDKALIAAKFGKGDLKFETPPFAMMTDNKTPEFLAKNPVGKVPVLDTPEGSIFESNAIARYVARKSDLALLGTTDIEIAHIDQWTEFYTHEFEAGLFAILPHIFGRNKFEKDSQFNAEIQKIKKSLAVLEYWFSHDASRQFIAINRVTIADIILVVGLNAAFEFVVGEESRKEYPKTIEYVDRLMATEQFSSVLKKNWKTEDAKF
eukprot:TRINITY_DN9044_c0_g1_i1.p1 TRINITY_DN9044_c0_g1~~TRINITY_DN9044_c0_g1_i1.p1  ORF type:complete len:247 (+),score=48.05 TRINITY_DN9044_c0_g1_i1:87-743(+)